MKGRFDDSASAISWLDEETVKGKAITDIVFSGDAPWLVKNAMRSLFCNLVDDSHGIPLKVREQDIPDEITVTRGRAAYGCETVLVLDGAPAIGISVSEGTICFRKVRKVIRKNHNIDDSRLFDPVFGRHIGSYRIRHESWKAENRIRAIDFYFQEGLILDVGSAGVYILNGESDPMQISMGEKKTMIRNYSSLFDDELLWR